MKPRFSFRGIGDDRLDHADSLKVEIHRVGSTLALRFEVVGCVGHICDEEAGPNQAQEVATFAESLLSSFGPRPEGHDGCCDCY